MPKTLGEIAIDAGLINKAAAKKAGRMADERGLPLIVVLVRELGIDELVLVAALRKQTRVPVLDPAVAQIDPEALRHVSRDVCARLRAIPYGLVADGATRILRIAMADPTDTAALAELEQLTQCEIDVAALPLSAIEELVSKGYRHVSTAVVARPDLFLPPDAVEAEVSVTAQIPLSALLTGAPASAERDETERRLSALVSVLEAKGLVTEAELAEAMRRLK